MSVGVEGAVQQPQRITFIVRNNPNEVHRTKWTDQIHVVLIHFPMPYKPCHIPYVGEREADGGQN